MSMKKWCLPLALLLSASAANAADRAAFNAAFAAAEKERNAAGAVGFEWRDTRKMLKRAISLAEKGDFDKAIALAKQAEEQGKDGQAQAALQAKVWKDFVIK